MLGEHSLSHLHPLFSNCHCIYGNVMVLSLGMSISFILLKLYVPVHLCLPYSFLNVHGCKYLATNKTFEIEVNM